MKLRSPLFAPGDSARKMEKALAGPADAVIIDLEDSVAAAADSRRTGTVVFGQKRTLNLMGICLG